MEAEQLQERVYEIILNLVGTDNTDRDRALRELYPRKTVPPCLEGEKKLMLAILKDAIAYFQKNIFARNTRRKTLFKEAEEWILERDSYWLFSFDSICEFLGMNPNYVRQGLIRWGEREIEKKKSNNLGDLVSPEGAQEGEITLKSRYIEELTIAVCLNYQKKPKIHEIYKDISMVLEKSANTVRADFGGVYQTLDVNNIFSAVYLSLDKGILHLDELANGKEEDFIKKLKTLFGKDELANGKLEDVIKKTETLSSDEEEVLKKYGEQTLLERNATQKYVFNALKIPYKGLQSLENGIYSKLGTCNPAQLAVASYFVVNKQSGRLPDATIAPPA